MALKIDEAKTPRGYRYLHIQLNGALTAEEAQALLDVTNPGTRYDNVPLMAVLPEGSDVPAAARKVIAQGNFKRQPVAAVAGSVALRVLVNFMSKVIGISRLKMVATSEEGLAYLEESIPKGWDDARPEQQQPQ